MEWRFWARTRPAQFEVSEYVSAYVSEDDCDAIEPLLSLYGDGMASADEERLVEAHLPGCESCRESLAWMQATRRALTGRPVQLPPADLHARIAEAIAASEAAPLRLRPARTFATRPAFAAAASLAAVGLFLGYSLTHLPRPGVPPHSRPTPSVAVVPATPPLVPVTPWKPATPTPAMNKPRPAPLVASKNSETDDALPTPAVTPEAAPPLRLFQPSARHESKTAVKTAPPSVTPTVAPRMKPVPPRSTSLVAINPPKAVKHTPAPVPTKAPVAVASADTKGSVKSSDVQVLPATVTPQEPPAPVQPASVTPSEPRVQTADFLREVVAHLPSHRRGDSMTVGISLRGAAIATHTFDSETGATRVANMVGVAR